MNHITFDRIDPIDPRTIRDGELHLFAGAAVRLEHALVAFRFLVGGVAEAALVVLDRTTRRAAVGWGTRYGETALRHDDTPDTVLVRFAAEGSAWEGA